jgi:23S rRNA (adenine2503-C2)-methyltransferase
MELPHLRSIPLDRLAGALDDAGATNAPLLARRLAAAVHRDGALTPDDLAPTGVGWRTRALLSERFDFRPLLEPAGERVSGDGTRKAMFRLRTGETIEVVTIVNRGNRTLCLSSQAGCALGCTFCATGRLGLLRHLTAGEILESAARAQRATDARITDVVFMGMGEPLHNYEPVMAACDVLNHLDGPSIAKKRITVSTAGLTPGIRRFTSERRRWRLHLSLHSAVDRTREALMPVARRHPLDEVLQAMRDHQRELDRRWLTFQYVAIPDVNMDAEHGDALVSRLAGIRYILNVIPWNDPGAGDRAPTWHEVQAYTTDLRRVGCPVKVRYSAGKQDGMGCGQLSAETVAAVPTGGHMAAPPGIFSG